MADVYLQKVTQKVGTIRFHGVVDLNGFLKMMRDWLIDHKYLFFEREFKSKINPEGVKKEISWTAYLEATEYAKYTIDLTMIFLNCIDVEVVKNGQKIKLTSTRGLIEIACTCELDPFKRFGGNKWLQALQDWYHKYIIKREILFIHLDGLYYHTLKLQRAIKEYLEFEAKTSAK
ncbi:hypothetical protein HY641_02235 [Candidatus Woesearchaeota archaeon]|nr:hypothetical protein [Candidatus Woesearchaeota archaeon]